MINFAIEEVASKPEYKGLVIGNQGKNFCVGANIGLMLMEAQDDNFFELDMVIKQFQDMSMNIKYSEKQIVTAPFQMSVGGGTKELYLKMLRGMPKGLNFDLQQVSNAVFERIATAEVATSAEEARELGFLDNNDGISVNPDHLLHDAKQRVLALSMAGYQA